MATQMAAMSAVTNLHPNNTLSGNGSTVDITGALRTLILLTSIDGTAGIYTFEISRDGGQNWVAAAAVRDASAADSSALVAATPAGAPAALYKVDHVPGPALLRARISTNWVTSAPQVDAITIGK